MIMLASSPPDELLRLSDVSQELSVGLGHATASVRTLSNISLVLREQELVVLSGAKGAGERALLAVIAGDRRGVSGSCTVHKHARIRLLNISEAAALALVQEWHRAESFLKTPMQELPAQRDLILLDVVPAVTAPARASMPRDAARRAPRAWNEDNRSALLAWAAVCRQRKNAVLMASTDSLGRTLLNEAFPHVRGTSPPMVREPVVQSSSIRVIPMHSGRLAPAVPVVPLFSSREKAVSVRAAHHSHSDPLALHSTEQLPP